ncbi:peptidase S11 [Parasulfuritortus cantonensis]|uniref:Peptidase S11 n=2 Tax=Parasulfuritortus cantonensis TaxID=2528202 RepID=A0A4R1BIW5_9PROT|nr:peptidase S11 [Parasulfuritortus cantonensis]
MAQSAGTASVKPSAQAGKTVAKAKKKVSRVTSKKRYRARTHKRVVSETQERRLHMSQSLAQAPLEVSYGVVESSALNLRSAAVMVVDQKTGEALYAKNPDVATPIASITKLMTSMVVLDAGLPMTEEIVIGNEDVDRLKGSSSRLALGTTLSREELLHLALIASENRAASALSRSYPGGRPAFVQAMNAKAAALGMSHTWFVDGTGLDSSNRSTAADLVKLVDAASSYPLLRQITSTGQYGVTMPGRQVVRVKDHGRVRRVSREVMRQVAFNNTNALTRSPSWNIGLSKTGYINEAGHCLVMQANIADRPVIMVLLDSWGKLSRIGDAARVRKWLESQFSSGRLARLGDDPSV